MSLDGLPTAHLQVLLDGLPVFERYGLLLAGGYAFRAHEIVHRPSQDLDFATSDDTPLPEIAAQVRDAFPRWVTVQVTPAASVRAMSLDDTVGLKARAWHDRFVIRDIIDLEAILDHLAGVSVFTDDDFAEYGLDEPTITGLRNWVTGWYDDLGSRLAADLTDDGSS